MMIKGHRKLKGGCVVHSGVGAYYLPGHEANYVFESASTNEFFTDLFLVHSSCLSSK